MEDTGSKDTSGAPSILPSSQRAESTLEPVAVPPNRFWSGWTWKILLDSRFLSRLLNYINLMIGIGCLIIFITVYAVIRNTRTVIPICKSQWWLDFCDALIWVGIHGLLTFAADQFFAWQRLPAPDTEAADRNALHNYYRHNDSLRDKLELANYSLGLGLLALFLWGPTIISGTCLKYFPETKKPCSS